MSGYEDIPDAPWIREAEKYGAPPYGGECMDVFCPICGKECETIYIDGNDEVCGCEQCVQAMDAYEWQEKNREG